MVNLPFAALRALEAVVRLSSFSRAADELGVSQSAISQHVRLLEDWTGHRLLIRGGRETKPTVEGRDLALAVSDGFRQVASVTQRLRTKIRHGNTLTVSCLSGFGIN